MGSEELTMKCLSFCQLFTCILQVFASGFERHFLLDFSEAMFKMKQFERVGGSDCALCLFLLLKGTTEESTVYLPALYDEGLLCIYIMFI